MTEDRHRFVQQYVERQKAYLPTYTNKDLVNECHRTPSRTDVGFGFDTPVLRPRTTTLQVGPSTSRAHKADQKNPREALSPLGKKEKRKKASTPVDTDSERAASRSRLCIFLGRLGVEYTQD